MVAANDSLKTTLEQENSLACEHKCIQFLLTNAAVVCQRNLPQNATPNQIRNIIYLKDY